MTAPAIGVHAEPVTARRGPGREPGGWSLRGMLRGPAGQPAWARPALLALLAGTAILYLAGLDRNAWANDFYSAAVQAGSTSWKAFFFGSFDGSGFITVDKTPASLWVMDLSARVFGLNYWSVLVPQAVEGVACVGVLYAAVRRWFGPAAGLLAGAVLAVTPVAALMFRFNNPDALLVLLLTAAGYAITRAVESGRTRWIALAGALIGAGFLAKMLQALLVVPPLALAYLVAGPPRLGRRLLQLMAGAAAMIGAAGWWVAIVMLTPAADRPYVGGSTSNSILQLALGYNGLGRLDGNEAGSVGFGGQGGAGQGTAFGGPAGLTRLFGSVMGGQVAWLLPAALVALAAMIWLSRRAPRTDRTRAAALIWGGSLLVTGMVFSYMAGIIHPYYTVALAPAIGALVGIGVVTAWRIRASWQGRVILAGGVALTAWWSQELLGRTPSWHPLIRVTVVVAGLAAAAALAAGPWVASRLGTARGKVVAAPVAVAVALFAVFAGPAAYAVATVTTAHTGAIPTAGPAAALGGPGGGLGGPGGPGEMAGPGTAAGASGTAGTGAGTALPGGAASGTGGMAGAAGPGASASAGGNAGSAGRPGSRQPGGTGQAGRVPGTPGNSAAGPGGQGGPGGGLGGNTKVSSALAALLEKDAARYRWAAATVGTQSAAPLQLATRQPMLAIGGFNGTDPVPTLAQFERMVSAGEIHYFVGANSSSFGGGTGPAAQITAWVAAHFTARTVGGVTVYDLTQ
jgi:4-amino-4-deoxy-L-arabinose transferase-like glycosyltransferase